MDAVEALRGSGVERGDLVALTFAADVGVAMATPRGTVRVPAAVDDPADIVRCVEQALRPRWVTWSNASAIALVEHGVRVATAWDIAAVHRLIFGGWHAEPARVWAQLHGLDLGAIPKAGPPDLFSQAESGDGSPEDPIRPDGYLRPDWADGGWSSADDRLVAWAQLALRVAELQQQHLAASRDPTRAAMTARTESAAELLCAELSVDGLPMDRSAVEMLIAEFVGARPARNRTRPSSAYAATPR